MGFFDKERNKERKKIFSFSIVDKFVNKSFDFVISQNRKQVILVMDISKAMIDSPYFNIVLNNARTHKLPCFFIVSNSLTLPLNWDKGLNILFLDYYSNLTEYQDTETRAMESAYKFIDTGEA
jgi:hypothetical protein